MQLAWQFNCSGVDWQQVSETFKRVGMAYHDPVTHQKAFENSHTTVFVYHEKQLIGFGRAISDGAYQAAVYDIAVIPEFQGKGIGTTIMKEILKHVPGCNIILYSSPDKEGILQDARIPENENRHGVFHES